MTATYTCMAPPEVLVKICEWDTAINSTACPKKNENLSVKKKFAPVQLLCGKTRGQCREDAPVERLQKEDLEPLCEVDSVCSQLRGESCLKTQLPSSDAGAAATAVGAAQVQRAKRGREGEEAGLFNLRCWRLGGEKNSNRGEKMDWPDKCHPSNTVIL